MMSPEAAWGGGGSVVAVLTVHSDALHLLTHPQHPPLVAGSRSTAVLADRAGTGHREGEKGRGGGGGGGG